MSRKDKFDELVRQIETKFDLTINRHFEYSDGEYVINGSFSPREVKMISAVCEEMDLLIEDEILKGS